MVRQQCFVCGDDVGARVDCIENERARRLDAPHQFNDDVSFANKFGGVGRDEVSGNVHRTLRFRVANGNPDQLDTSANSRGQLISVIKNLVRNLRANTSRTEKRNSKVSIFNQ
ncbi:unannotated protein [freshwater metagenome]|uniref:Unannotated protein n=1 Tax=freshwater metagenome TaxID=449393 RepID=A0A6J7DMU0_9ZZZZ